MIKVEDLPDPTDCIANGARLGYRDSEDRRQFVDPGDRLPEDFPEYDLRVHLENGDAARVGEASDEGPGPATESQPEPGWDGDELPDPTECVAYQARIGYQAEQGRKFVDPGDRLPEDFPLDQLEAELESGTVAHHPRNADAQDEPEPESEDTTSEDEGEPQDGEDASPTDEPEPETDDAEASDEAETEADAETDAETDVEAAWREDYRAAQDKAKELGLPANQSHTDLIEKISARLEEA